MTILAKVLQVLAAAAALIKIVKPDALPRKGPKIDRL